MPKMPARFQRWIDARIAARHLNGRTFAKRYGGWHVAAARDRQTRTALRHLDRRARRRAKHWRGSWFVQDHRVSKSSAAIVRVISRAMRARSVPRALRRSTLPRVTASDRAHWVALNGRPR